MTLHPVQGTAGPQSGPQDFLVGWMLGEDQREVWGRPVGLLQLKDGSMLVSDDGGRKIWRISYGRIAAALTFSDRQHGIAEPVPPEVEAF